MEPLNDDELNQLLQRWKAPEAPASLAAKVLPQRTPWWSGSIRIPIPVALAIAAAVVMLWVFSSGSTGGSARKPIEQPAAGSVSIADFQPVRQLEPRVIGRANESH
jgi:hypothetical protein